MERNSRPLVIALASALGVALLVIVFLLGRMSAKPAVVTVTAPAPVAGPAASILPTSVLETAAAGETATPLPASEPSGLAPPVWSPVSATPAAPDVPGAARSPEQPQIAAYFDVVDRLEDMGAGDPQAFAASMIQSISSGDFSGFDDLLAKARTQRQRLQSIRPPGPCIEHHRLALSLSADSVAMLERLKAALMKGDSTVLMTMATEGKTLETQANQLKAMGESIKRQAGL